MPELLQALSDWPYIAWAFAAASVFYLVTSFAVSHLNPDRRAALSLYLQGDFRETWVSDFCALFDAVFGARHWGLRCVVLSAIASVLAVLALWMLLGPILGLVDLRSETALTLTQVLLIGAAINILPDYLSLYETRWLLKQFERVRNPIGQIAVLAVDAVVTGAIIYIGVTLFLLVQGEAPVSVVEVAALFSIYAVFFWSTFLTSVWAWGYCLSSWFAAISARLAGWLDLKGKPGASLALIGAVAIFVVALGLKPLLTVDDRGRIALDDVLCDVFPTQICPHLIRMSADEAEKLDLLGKVCAAGVTAECLAKGLEFYKVNNEDAAQLWGKACDGGNAPGCTNLGYLYRNGIGVEADASRAAALYGQGCDGGNLLGCTNLGFLYEKGLGVEADASRAAAFYGQACDGGNALGCTNLGFLYRNGLGVEADASRAAALYGQGCDGGNLLGCTNLGFLYQNGLGVEADASRAAALFVQGCDGGNAPGCSNLGFLYEKGLGVEADASRAAALYGQGCDGGNALGCSNLGVMHESGEVGSPDAGRANELYRRACEMGDARGCVFLGMNYRTGLGVDADVAEAARLHQLGCDGDEELGCHSLAVLYQSGDGVPQDPTRAQELFAKACDLGHAPSCEALGLPRD